MICVTGMHRSGTSLVTGMLAELGLDIGVPSYFMPADAANPDGYFENLLVFKVNEMLLEKLGGAWDAPPDLGRNWARGPHLGQLRRIGRAVLDRSFQDRPEPRGLKDPRFALTLPFWRTITDFDKTILVVRDPSEVAASLRERDGLDAETSARLWIRYNVSAWVDARERVVVDYRALTEDLDGYVELLAGVMEAQPDAERRAAAKALVRPARSTPEAAQPIGPEMERARELYAAIVAGDDAAVSKRAHALHEKWSKAVDVAALREARKEARRQRWRLRARIEWSIKHPLTVPGLIAGRVKRVVTSRRS